MGTIEHPAAEVCGESAGVANTLFGEAPSRVGYPIPGHGMAKALCRQATSWPDVQPRVPWEVAEHMLVTLEAAVPQRK